MSFIENWLPYILAGISVGGQYALIAIGYTMVYGILKLIKKRFILMKNMMFLIIISDFYIGAQCY